MYEYIFKNSLLSAIPDTFQNNIIYYFVFKFIENSPIRIYFLLLIIKAVGKTIFPNAYFYAIKFDI